LKQSRKLPGRLDRVQGKGFSAARDDDGIAAYEAKRKREAGVLAGKIDPLLCEGRPNGREDGILGQGVKEEGKEDEDKKKGAQGR
jgi:hypothetical protein